MTEEAIVHVPLFEDESNLRFPVDSGVVRESQGHSAQRDRTGRSTNIGNQIGLLKRTEANADRSCNA